MHYYFSILLISCRHVVFLASQSVICENLFSSLAACQRFHVELPERLDSATQNHNQNQYQSQDSMDFGGIR